MSPLTTCIVQNLFSLLILSGQKYPNGLLIIVVVVVTCLFFHHPALDRSLPLTIVGLDYWSSLDHLKVSFISRPSHPTLLLPTIALG